MLAPTSTIDDLEDLGTDCEVEPIVKEDDLGGRGRTDSWLVRQPDLATADLRYEHQGFGLCIKSNTV